jgi:hypothetical protein
MIYLDDILLATETMEEHIQLLTEVLQRLVNAGITLNSEKCVVMEEEVSFLGYKWSKRGVRILDDPIQKLLSFEEPKSQTELRSFLGLASYIGATNIPHYSSLVEPLWKLCGAASWRWNEEARLEWQKLRNQIKCISRRTLFDPTKPVVVQSDASPSGFGAVMLQNSNPVLYASRKLTSAERNYSQIEKEASAALYAMKRFSIFLLGRNFTLQTDHQPLFNYGRNLPMKCLPG